MIVNKYQGNGGGGGGSASNILPAITSQAEYAAISGNVKSGDLIQVLDVDINGDGDNEYGLFANVASEGDIDWVRRDNGDSVLWSDNDYPWMVDNDTYPIDIAECSFLIAPDYTSEDDAFNGIGFDADGKPVITHIVPQTDEQTGEITGMTRTDTPIGAGGGDSPILPLNSLDDEGVEGVLYEMDGHLYKWVDADGKWGRWIYNVYDDKGEADYGNKGNYLVYTDLRPADGEKICTLHILSKYYRVELDIEDESLYIYDERYSGGNLVATVVPNSAVTITNSSRSFRITWFPDKNYIEFYDPAAWAEVLDMISTAQTGAHFEALLVDEFRAPNFCGPNFGIPAWNSDGTVVGRRFNLDKSVKKINTTGYGNNITLFTDGSHQSYGSWFIPTQPGNAGQVLTSAGNAEPQWATIIKAVQITSAAYDALVQAGTTDPNTLYLIVD